MHKSIPMRHLPADKWPRQLVYPTSCKMARRPSPRELSREPSLLTIDLRAPDSTTVVKHFHVPARLCNGNPRKLTQASESQAGHSGQREALCSWKCRHILCIVLWSRRVHLHQSETMKSKGLSTKAQFATHMEQRTSPSNFQKTSRMQDLWLLVQKGLLDNSSIDLGVEILEGLG